MRLKVIALATLSIFLSGCSWTSAPKPKEPKKPNVKVVEEIQAEQNTTISTIEPTEIKETTKNKYNLKPEPFSLESNEDDPELLGPQTTIDRGLKKENKDTKTEEKSDKVVKKEEKESSTNENKKETL